jgi:hypothetical protein
MKLAVLPRASLGMVWIEFSRLIRLRPSQSSDESGIMGLRFSGKCGVMRAQSLPLFELARVLVRLDHVASFIINAK